MNIQIVETVLNIFDTYGDAIRFDNERFESLLNDKAPTMVNECYLIVQGIKLGIFDTMIFDELKNYSVYYNYLVDSGDYTVEETIFMIKCFEYIVDKMGYYFDVGDVSKLLDTALKTSDIPSLTLLANAYFSGYGVKQDYLQALEIMLFVSEAGYHHFDAKIGYLYEHGLGTEKDMDIALFYYNQEDSECYYVMGKLYCEGIFVEKSYDKAIEYFEKSDDKKSYYYLGLLYEHKGRYADAFMAYTKGFHYLDGNCFYRAALLQTKGKGVVKDDKNAKHYFKCAYYCRNELAAYELGVIKINKGQYPKGIYYLKQASKLGSKDASLLLAKYYESGTYVDKDLQKSAIYYRKALELKL